MDDETRASLQKQLEGIVGASTIAEMTDAQLQNALEAVQKSNSAREIARQIEEAHEARQALTPSSRRKGGPVHKNKRPQMKHGGVHKGKKHAYAAGGMVKDMNIMRSK
jgi:hypothetical protein